MLFWARLGISGVLAAGTMCMACGGGTGGTGPHTPAQRIAYQSREFSGMPNLIVMNPDGSGVTPVAASQEDDESPVLSPDASRIAFSSHRDGQWHIYLIHVDGTGLERVTSDTFPDVQPSWSPEGSRLVFCRGSSGSEGVGLRTIRTDGTDLRVVTTSADLGPAWSPDGGRIAFSRNGKIMVVGPDGSGLQQLTDSILVAGDPAWSPDGARIAFSGIAPGGQATDIFVMRADGSGQSNLTGTPTMGEAQPAWSPDGAYVLFAGARRFDAEHFLGNLEIVRRAADGSGEVILTNSPAEDLHPAWGQGPH